MQVGDKVQVLGTVRDIVDESVLMVTDDGREYWHLKVHVTEQPMPGVPPSAVPGTEAAPGGAIKSFPPIKSHSELESMTKAELEAYGKKLGLHLESYMTKDDMIEEIENAAKPK